VLVVGDVMLDRYWVGVATRISPEAPVPVVLKESETLTPGGAANVACNISSLSGEALLYGVTGNDADGQELRRELASHHVATDGLARTESRATTVKTRIVAHQQQIVRVDQEDTTPFEVTTVDELIRDVASQVTRVDAVVISDYAKGVFAGTRLLSAIISGAQEREIPVLVDPKGGDLAKYAGATLVTPNAHEAIRATGGGSIDHESVWRAGQRLAEDCDIGGVLVTEGDRGMTLFRRDHAPASVAAWPRKVFDVTGAGDTVISAMALALAAGMGWESGMQIANYAAGLAVESVGTVVVTAESLMTAMSSIPGISP
jgi:rfaE bifunctional protein kinase chain/domain